MWLTWCYSDFSSFTPEVKIITVLHLHSELQQKLHVSEKWAKVFKKQAIAEQNRDRVPLLHFDTQEKPEIQDLFKYYLYNGALRVISHQQLTNLSSRM